MIGQVIARYGIRERLSQLSIRRELALLEIRGLPDPHVGLGRPVRPVGSRTRRPT
jgi:hypothetical protein